MSEKNTFYMKCFSMTEAVEKIQLFFFFKEKRERNNNHIFYLENTFSKASQKHVFCLMSGIILIYYAGV